MWFWCGFSCSASSMLAGFGWTFSGMCKCRTLRPLEQTPVCGGMNKHRSLAPWMNVQTPVSGSMNTYQSLVAWPNTCSQSKRSRKMGMIARREGCTPMIVVRGIWATPRMIMQTVHSPGCIQFTQEHDIYAGINKWVWYHKQFNEDK